MVSLNLNVIAEGVVTAYKQVNVQVPVVIRLQGTNADKAEDIIANSGLGARVIMVKAFADAAQKAVEISKN